MTRKAKNPQESKWAKRFVLATVIQAMLALGLTAWLLYQFAFGAPSPSRIVAGGGAGTWFTMGYMAYLILGVLATAGVALFFHYGETRLGLKFRGWTNALAWGSILLWNAGIVAATWLMMHAGYSGGGAAISVENGGLGYNGAQVHQIMVAYPEAIAIAMAVALLGAFLGLVAYVAAWARPQTTRVPMSAAVED